MRVHLLAAAAQTVECTNCGGTDTLAIVAIAVAVLSVAIAVWSAVHQTASVKMQRREHDAFLARIGAFPDISFEPRSVDPPADAEGVIRIGARAVTVLIDLGFRNVGRAPAEHVSVNVWLPESVMFHLAGPGGFVAGGNPSRDSSDVLTLSDGTTTPIHWRRLDVGHVIPGTYNPVQISVEVRIPETQRAVTIPMRLVVLGDDLGPDWNADVETDHGATRIDFDHQFRFELA